MTIQVDVWGGDLHQRHVSEHYFDSFQKAVNLISEQIEAGNLCNILHTDFVAPTERVSEQKAEMVKHLKPTGKKT
jgi:hypothetical protein